MGISVREAGCLGNYFGTSNASTVIVSSCFTSLGWEKMYIFVGPSLFHTDAPICPGESVDAD